MDEELSKKEFPGLYSEQTCKSDSECKYPSLGCEPPTVRAILGLARPH